MKKDSLTDYSGYILFKTLGPLIRKLPLAFSFFLGRRIGDLFYFLDFRHKALVYANVKTAFGSDLSCRQIKDIVHNFYRVYGQNFVEILLMPLIDKEYIDKYIETEGTEYVEEGFRRGRGVIFVSVHAGSWELSNIMSAYLGLPFLLFVQNQRYPRLNKLLNYYRLQKGCKIVEGEGGVRQLIKAIKDNQAIGMTVDQGGRDGTLVDFFKKSASMPSGAVRFALKYGAAIIPVYYTRKKGPRIKVIFEPIFEIQESGDLEKDVVNNLQGLVGVYEKNIRKYPQEYLWTYKIWKYGNQKRILILSDGKAGHLRQSQAVAKASADYLNNKGMHVKVDTVEVGFKNNLSRKAFVLSTCLSGKYSCQGCLWCFRRFLDDRTYKGLAMLKPDMIISCGSALAPVNYCLARENLAKSAVVLRPGMLSVNKFDLVIMPRHDNPPKKKNITVIEGALNLIDKGYLKDQADKMASSFGLRPSSFAFFIGVLIGGDTKNFHMDSVSVLEVLNQIKETAEKYNAGILITTSRRTPPEVEALIKEQMSAYARCRLLVVANEKNIPEAVGGILGLSEFVIVSPESISMISEAASSGKHVLVFNSGIDAKHTSFVKYMHERGYICALKAKDIFLKVGALLKETAKTNVLDDRAKISEALGRLF